MHTLPDSANRLIDELARLPGIGRKTAQRLAFHFLSSDVELSHSLSNALLDIKQKIKNCLTCHGITEEDPCKICVVIKNIYYCKFATNEKELQG